ncbi:uncharacterized protein LDX57_009270 [Aspergillus melleus]|uniref:uncharacterized protein n=1 Tax=Aspergillus melleus TaxID=138277 RepID=UPI001E8D435C|nr:uncharacterized protein LDX57_009270 [Aspergillus melleus]KAH8431613.1 hypothetical protein LDX57_009270 [Aspergillus melleus]
MKWVNALDKANKRDAFAWPHSTRAGMNYFRLDDHVWIWNAIKAISIILGWDTMAKGNFKSREKVDKDSWQYQRNELMRRYEPEKMKREILQRFTTVHDVSKERILAVTRSPRETRFEFHSRDTALFYPIVDTMLGQGEERWLGLIKLQKRFTRTQDTDPDNLLRHGLGMLMENTWATDSTMRTDFLETKRALITTTLTNGLFPAQITGLGESERVSYHEDYLLHVSFEMPYILHATRPQEGPFQQATQEGLTKNRLYEEGPVKHTSILDGTIPFNDQIDVKSIIDIREEWLYNSPSFLDWSPLNGNHIPLSLLDLGVKRVRWIMRALLKAYGDETSEEINEESEEDSGDDDDIMVDAAGVRSISNPGEYQPLDIQPDGHKHLMIDIGKKRPRMRKTSCSDERESRTHTYVKSWEKLLQVRTAHSAKKRFLWCRNPPGEYALMCYLASPENEQPSLRLFFDRHAKCVTDFDDKTSRVYNTWETEFHCTFVRLGKPARPINSEDASSNLNESHKEERRPEPMLHSSIRPLPDLGGQELRPASMGFRFHGDFFDRFWTCHYVESYLGEPPRLDMNNYLSSNGEELKRLFQDSSAYVWQQRKVLETLLFHLILSEINKSVQKIIKAIQEELSSDQHGKERVKTPKPSQFDSEVYFNDLKAWAALHEILEFLGDNLENISNNVKGWNSREEDRRTEKPRWTNNDEKKYRDAITRALLECQRAERVLFAHRATIRSLSKTLNYRREEAKNEYDRNMSERNFRNNDNVKYFTYSTVIFLSLGFAASVYSMQAAPPTDVLQHMVIFSVVAFFTLLVIIAILPFLLEGSSGFRRVCREFVLHGFRGCCRNIYQDSKDLHGFWKLFYTKVPYTFSDLFTMQIPSYVLLLKGQSLNPGSSNRKEHAKKQKQQAPKPEESLDGNSRNTLKRETRDELKFDKSKGESWVQSWNRIVEPWNKSLRGHR